MPKNNQITVITEDDIKGKVYVIGDVHGELAAFKAVLDTLTPDDILIIAGDLIDRGEADPNNPTSAQLLDTLIQINNSPAGTHPQIYSITGNHEMDFLLILNLCMRIKQKEQLPPIIKDMFRAFIKNGGHWIFRHDEDNTAQQDRLHYFHDYATGDKSPECIDKVTFYINQVFQSDDLFAELIPNIQTYIKFIRDLPFVIKIEGVHPALVTHADLSFSDEEIDRRILSKEVFTHAEKVYMTNARVKEFQSNGDRNESSQLVIVGHNIINEPNDPLAAHPAVPVRAETNHINLDGGAYFTKGFLVLNLTENQIDIVGNDITAENTAFLNYAKNTIQEHLDTLAPDPDSRASKRQRI